MHMKKTLTLLLLALLPLLAGAQTRFGYLSYDTVFHAMPEYAAACRTLADLKAKYEAETKRAESEFNAKYEEFLDGQRDFVPSILQKRQAELQDLMERNTAFRDQARQLLAAAERDAFAPIRTRLAQAIARVGRDHGYAFILNTDGNACPYIDPASGDDVTVLVKNALGKN